jgi:curved DNA-binding protein CbpA
MTAFDTAWDLLKDLSLREQYDIDEEGVPVFDLRVFSDLGGELPEGEMEDVTGDPFYTWDELNQEDMDEFDPIMQLYYELGNEAYREGFGNVKNYDPFEEYYEAPYNDILNFVDHLRFWSGEMPFDTPFGPQFHPPEEKAQDMLRRWREGSEAHAKKYGGA